MFRLQIESHKYSTKFYHIQNELGKKVSTLCLIEEILEDGEKSTVGAGQTLCSKKDNFDRNKGRLISFTRALKNSGFDRITRLKFWYEYHKAHKKNLHDFLSTLNEEENLEVVYNL